MMHVTRLCVYNIHFNDLTCSDDHASDVCVRVYMCVYVWSSGIYLYIHIHILCRTPTYSIIQCTTSATSSALHSTAVYNTYRTETLCLPIPLYLHVWVYKHVYILRPGSSALLEIYSMQYMCVLFDLLLYYNVYTGSANTGYDTDCIAQVMGLAQDSTTMQGVSQYSTQKCTCTCACTCTCSQPITPTKHLPLSFPCVLTSTHCPDPGPQL